MSKAELISSTSDSDPQDIWNKGMGRRGFLELAAELTGTLVVVPGLLTALFGNSEAGIGIEELSPEMQKLIANIQGASVRRVEVVSPNLLSSPIDVVRAGMYVVNADSNPQQIYRPDAAAKTDGIERRALPEIPVGKALALMSGIEPCLQHISILVTYPLQ